MQRFLRYSIDFTNIIMITLFSFIGTWYLYTLLNFNITPSLPILYFCLLLITYCFRLLIRHLVVYLLTHATILCCILVLPVLLPVKVATILFFVILFFRSMNYWLNNHIELIIDLPIYFVFIFILPLLHATPTILRNTSYLLAFIYIGIYLLRVFLTNIFHFFQDSLGVDCIPYHDIVKRNTLYAVAMISSLLLIPYLTQLQFLSNAVKQLLHQFFSALKHFLHFLFSLLPIEETPNDITPTPFDLKGSGLPLAPAKNSTPFLEFLYSLLWYLTQFVIVIGFFTILVYFIYLFFKKHMYKKRNTSIATESSSVIETREPIRQQKKQKSIPFYKKLSPKEKIRIQYKKQIIQLQKKGYICNEVHTPRQRSFDVAQNQNIDIIELTQLYEIARYDNEVPTKES